MIEKRIKPTYDSKLEDKIIQSSLVIVQKKSFFDELGILFTEINMPKLKLAFIGVFLLGISLNLLTNTFQMDSNANTIETDFYITGELP